jgi:hypothetical protein
MAAASASVTRYMIHGPENGDHLTGGKRSRGLSIVLVFRFCVALDLSRSRVIFVGKIVESFDRASVGNRGGDLSIPARALSQFGRFHGSRNA